MALEDVTGEGLDSPDVDAGLGEVLHPAASEGVPAPARCAGLCFQG